MVPGHRYELCFISSGADPPEVLNWGSLLLDAFPVEELPVVLDRDAAAIAVDWMISLYHQRTNRVYST